jgi:hypothetical protein
MARTCGRWEFQLIRGKEFYSPTPRRLSRRYARPTVAQAHGFGVGFPGEVNIGRNGSKHLAGAGGFAIIFGNKFLLKVHGATS